MQTWYNDATTHFHTFRKPKFMNTFEAQLTQHVRPDGRSKQVLTPLPIEVETLYKQMLEAGCRLESEVLRTNEVSVTVSNVSAEVDIDFSVTPNGPEVQSGIISMLRRASWITHTAKRNQTHDTE